MELELLHRDENYSIRIDAEEAQTCGQLFGLIRNRTDFEKAEAEWLGMAMVLLAFVEMSRLGAVNPARLRIALDPYYLKDETGREGFAEGRQRASDVVGECGTDTDAVPAAIANLLSTPLTP